MRPITETHDRVRQLMADFVPRTAQEVADALGIAKVDASTCLSELKRHEYSVVIVDRQGVPGFGNGGGPALWQRRMFDLGRGAPA